MTQRDKFNLMRSSCQNATGEASSFSASNPARNDKNPSLSVTIKTDGRIMINDFAAGTSGVEAFLEYCGFSIVDLYPVKDKHSRKEIRRHRWTGRRTDGAIETLWHIKYSDGAWRWFNETRNVWKHTRRGLTLSPYGAKHFATNDVRVICAGEKDCDYINSVSDGTFSATTGANGEGSFDKSLLNTCADKQVVVVFDLDAAGSSGATKHAEQLIVTSKSVKIADLRTIAPQFELRETHGLDISDVPNLTADMMHLLIDSAELFKVQVPSCYAINNDLNLVLPPIDKLGTGNFTLDNVGDGALFAEILRGRVMFAEDIERFMIYDPSSGLWSKDSKAFLKTRELATAVTRQLVVHTVKNNQLVSHYTSTLNDAVQYVVIRQMRVWNKCKFTDFDKRQDLLSCKNAVLDLSDINAVKTISKSPDNMLTMVTSALYDPMATCPLWEAHIEKIMEGNPDKMRYLQAVLGAPLIGGNKRTKSYGFIGILTRNGKSTTLSVVCDTLGDYSAMCNPHTFAKPPSGSAPSPDFARLHNKRLVVISEPPQAYYVSSATFKSLTGNQSDRHGIPVRQLYEGIFELIPQFIPFFDSNHKIHFDDMSVYQSGRIENLSFDYHIPEDERDTSLMQKLEVEKSGILNWLIAGAKVYYSEDFYAPTEVANFTAEAAELDDKTQRFIDECCIETGDSKDREQVQALYSAYREWCMATGVSALNLSNFTEHLRRHGQVRRYYEDGSSGRKVYYLCGYLLVAIDKNKHSYINHVVF